MARKAARRKMPDKSAAETLRADYSDYRVLGLGEGSTAARLRNGSLHTEDHFVVNQWSRAMRGMPPGPDLIEKRKLLPDFWRETEISWGGRGLTIWWPEEQGLWAFHNVFANPADADKFWPPAPKDNFIIKRLEACHGRGNSAHRCRVRRQGPKK